MPSPNNPTTGATSNDSASATLTFTDTAGVEMVTPSQNSVAFAWSGGTLWAVQQDALAAQGSLVFTSTTPSALHGSIYQGSVGLSYIAPDHIFDFLATGETLTATYGVVVTDPDGRFSQQPVAFKVTGANDAPVLATDASDPHSTSDVAGQATASATLNFTDADLNDTHTISAGVPTFVWSAARSQHSSRPISRRRLPCLRSSPTCVTDQARLPCPSACRIRRSHFCERRDDPSDLQHDGDGQSRCGIVGQPETFEVACYCAEHRSRHPAARFRLKRLRSATG